MSKMDDPWPWLAFGSGLVLLALFLVGISLPEPPASHGAPHAEVAGMLHGGSGAERHGDRLWLGWAVGACEILFFLSLIALGARKGRSLRGMGCPLWIGGLVYLGVWTLLMVAYGAYVHDADPALILALPAPTAVMLYLLYPMPIFFIALFVLGFRRWVLTEEDQQAFHQLVAEQRRAAEQGRGEPLPAAEVR